MQVEFWGGWMLDRVNNTTWCYTSCIYRGEQGEMEKQRAAIKCLLDTTHCGNLFTQIPACLLQQCWKDYMYCYLHSKPKLRDVCYPHFMSEESKACKSVVICKNAYN